MKIFNQLRKLWKDQSGQDLVEYALLLVLLGLAAIAATNTLSGAVQNTFKSAAATIQQQVPGNSN
jgi:Flp pilus assembly pilin Flp